MVVKASGENSELLHLGQIDEIANESETPRFSNGAEVLILSSRSEVD